MVGLAVLLAAALVTEVAFGDSGDLGSISAYYYTPVRSIFVGALLGMGLGLITIKGRDRNGEDVLLNVAGVLAPLVALVPTPVRVGEVINGSAVTYLSGADKCVPKEFVPGVENNVSSVLFVALLGWSLALVMARREGPLAVPTKRGLGIVAVLIIAFGLPFVVPVWHDWFLVTAHYAAAIPMFGILVIVMWINALGSTATLAIRGQSLHYNKFYGTLSMVTAVMLVMALAYALLLLFDIVGPWQGWIFVVEALLLFLFAIFWAFQTVEFYAGGVPGE